MTKEKMTEGAIMQALNWTYDKVLAGLPGFESATELGDDYLKHEGSLRDRANSLIRWQVAKASAAGFVTGLGGMITMPITVPADFAAMLAIQLRMIAAIAHMGGHDVHEDQVRTLGFICLCGEAPAEFIRGTGIKLGEKLAEKAVQAVSADVIKAINKAVGFRLFTKFGEKGLINIGKAVPILGAGVGATFDGVATNTVGNYARDHFIPV